MKLENDALAQIVTRILQSPKYRGKGIQPDTVRDLILKDAPNYNSSKELTKSVRRKLHNIVAPYLGEPDYKALTEKWLNIKGPSPDSPLTRTLCLDILSQHASTKERIPTLESFYAQIFEITGTPDSILDLACGHHPIGFPFMHLPISTRYHAYDIIQPRINFINLFFESLGLLPLAENRDILVSPPKIHADVGFFLKEAHRFEKRAPGSNRKFWEALNVDALVVSLPAHNLTGTHALVEQHRRLVDENLPPSREIVNLQIGDEMLFILKKRGG